MKTKASLCPMPIPPGAYIVENTTVDGWVGKRMAACKKLYNEWLGENMSKGENCITNRV